MADTESREYSFVSDPTWVPPAAHDKIRLFAHSRGFTFEEVLEVATSSHVAWEAIVNR